MKNIATKAFKKVKKTVVNSRGFITRKGKLLNYVELHALGVGFLDGFLTPGSDHFDRLEQAKELYPDVEKEPQYFTKGFFWGKQSFYWTGFVILVAAGLAVSWVEKSP